MADGKWINGLKAATPLSQAARKALAARLHAVRDCLRPALKKPDEDTEHVHQLRVATRRARAALDIFEDCLADKVYRRLRKALRRIRRGAGEARDWDVFLEEIQNHLQTATQLRRPGFIFLAGYGSVRREDAQTLLEEQTDGIDLSEMIKDALDAVSDAEKFDTLGELAQKQLQELLHEFESAAKGNLNKYERLHEVRIIGKRLRYAMEVFAGCYAEPFRDKLYVLVEQMQDILGEANDSVVAAQRLGTIREQVRQMQPRVWKEVKSGIESLLRYHERRLPAQRKKFERWWARWQKLDVEQGLESLLGARKKKKLKARTPAAPPAAEPPRPEEASPAEVVPFPEAAAESTPEAQAAASPSPPTPAAG